MSNHPVLTVLCAEPSPDARPPSLVDMERLAEVRYATAADLPEAIRGADALLLWDFTSTALRAAWPHADRLRWVHVASAGVDRLLTPELVASEVVVTNSRGVFDRSIAEYVLGLLLLFAKDILGTLRRQRARTWEHRESEMLAGGSALVVGVGPIGRAIARLLIATGVRVRGVGRTARTGDPDLGDVLATADLHAALGDADFVVVAAPLTGQTRGLFDAAAFAAMRPTARLVNVGRGPIVVEADLVEALRSGAIAGAALDVFEREPLPADSPLWDLPNVVVSPHMSADFHGWLDALAALFADQFLRWVAGGPLRNVVDKRLGYVTGEETAHGH